MSAPRIVARQVAAPVAQTSMVFLLLERLARYEVHLDRKLERSLTMLFHLKELRPLAAES